MLKNFTKNKKEKNNGYTLVEILFYISIFGILSLVVINSMIVMTKAFRETTINRDIMQAGNIMERMSRDIRRSNIVLSMNVNGTNLELNTLILNQDQVYQPVKFVYSGTDIQLYENNVFIGNLNSPDIAVTTLTFDPILNTVAGAVKMSMTVQSKHYGSTRTETFYDTVILRGGY